MTYDQAKNIVNSARDRTEEEVAAAWAVMLSAGRDAILPKPDGDQAEPLPSKGKVYRPYHGVGYWWDVPSKSWHLKSDREDSPVETFRLMKEAKARAKVISEEIS